MQTGIVELLLLDSVQDFIFQNEGLDTRDFVLRGRAVSGISPSLIAAQIAGRKKSRTKLPEYYSTRGVIYPPTLNLEQSSSSVTARFKIENALESVRRNNLAIDLTGGFGVDTLFLSQKFSRVIYVEPNAELLAIARHNHQTLQATNIHHVAMTAEEFMASLQDSADVVFIDPSRRTEHNKVAGLRDSLPDVTRLQSGIHAKAGFLLVKASPLLDIKAALKDLTNVSDVFVLSVDNDCKELLFLAQRSEENPPKIHAVNIENRIRETFSFTYREESEATPSYSQPLRYLYEPNVSILKAGAFKLVALRFGLAKLDPHSHLYTSSEVIIDFPGRVFQLQAEVQAASRAIHQLFPEQKANVIARNYPLTVDEIRSRYKIKDGGEGYLIATRAGNKHLMLAAKRLK